LIFIDFLPFVDLYNESKVEEEAYAQAKEEKEEDEGKV